MISVNDIKLTTDKVVLNGITLSFEKNKVYAIFGESGSGKSTLLKCMANLVDFSGTIELDGINILNIPATTLRKQVLYVNQASILPEDTVKESLMLPFTFAANSGKEPSMANIKSLMKLFMLPESYLYENPAKLSGGEKQRVQLIRAILLKPDYLLLDEPTSALDVKTQGIVMEIFKDLAKNCGVIMVTHSVDMVTMSDIKIRIQEGKVANVWESELSSELIREAIQGQV